MKNNIIHEGQIDYLRINNQMSYREGFTHKINSNVAHDIQSLIGSSKQNQPDTIVKILNEDFNTLMRYAKTEDPNAFTDIIPIITYSPMKVIPCSDKNVVFINFNNYKQLSVDDIFAIYLYAKIYTKLFNISNVSLDISNGVQHLLGNIFNSLFAKKFGYYEDEQALKFVILGFHQYVLKKFFKIETNLYPKVLKYSDNLEVDHEILQNLCDLIGSKPQTLTNLFSSLMELQICNIDVNMVISQMLSISNPEIISAFSCFDRFIALVSIFSIAKYNVITKSFSRYIKTKYQKYMMEWAIKLLK